MTTSCGENWHPSGKRGFTDREFACLQGFPLEHKFGPMGVKRQIGNAVPPVVARVLFEGIRRFMEGTDGVVREDGGGDGDGEGEGSGGVGVGDGMDGHREMEGVRIGDDEREVEVVNMVSETDSEDGDGEEDRMELLNEGIDDEVEIVGAKKVKRQFS